MSIHSTPTTAAKRFAKIIVPALLLPITLGLSSSAIALTQGQCADAVVASCNKSYPNNYEARIACVNNGLNSCDTLAQNSGGGEHSSRPLRRLKFKR